MKKARTVLLLLGLASAAWGGASLDDVRVVWTSPSQNAHGSMPMGNGDVGINAWVEPSGDLVFYISKTDAWDENGRLCKIGRVRVKFEPALAVTNHFRQELKLKEGVIEIQAGVGRRQSKLLLWVDALAPVVRVESESDEPVTCRAEVELWRLRARPLGGDDDSHSGNGLAGSAFKPTVLPDVVVPAEPARVTWYHRNTRSMYGLTLGVQHLEAWKDRFPDPLLNRTFGARLTGEGWVRDGARALRAPAPAQRHRLAVTVLAARTETADAWLAQLDRLEQKPAASRRAHEKWWREFWDRSWIFVDGGQLFPLPANAHAWRVGADSDGASRFGGTITDAQVTGSALSPAAIAQSAAAPRREQTAAPADVPLRDGCTVSAWIKPAAGERGRILDKCTAGTADGMLFDAYPELSLRWIVGDKVLSVPNCLQAGEWQHVAATADAATGARRLYLNGKLLKEEGADGPSFEVLTQGYVLQRFLNAGAGRGGSPIKFNGSIYTVEATPGASPETPAGDPDWRKWGGNYWFQNTRLAYWPMLAAGDFEMMQPWFKMYLDALPLSKARVQTYYRFDNAAVFPETMYFWGLPNNGDYGWTNPNPEPGNTYIRRHWNGNLELVMAMLDHFDFTQDRDFARHTLVPFADPVIAFFGLYWPKRDAAGKIIFEPSQAMEMYQVTTNPLPDVAALHVLLPRLLALPETVTTGAQRARWARLLSELPPVPVGEAHHQKVIKPAAQYGGASNLENPELYAVFPFRLFGVGRPDLDMARHTYALRGFRHNRGWCQDSIQAACLGLGDEAGRLVTARAAQINSDYRFPAMWGPNFDWIPDQDHGNNILTTLQFMLLQHVGDKIYLFPAWPKAWNVSFKLHAPKNTVVEGELRGGKVTALKVTPKARAADVVNLLEK